MDLESPAVQTREVLGARNGAGGKTAFECRDVIDKIKQHFSSLDKFHGALTEIICLYGSSGSGKRHIAIQAAREIVAVDGRKLLTVEAGTFEIFIRDYYNVYELVTGERLPSGLGVPLSLSKIKHTLESRRQEWLLLLLDVTNFIDDNNNNTRQKMNIYLPVRGQTLMTSSEVIPGAKKDRRGASKLVCALELNVSTSHMYHPNMAYSYFKDYARHLCPALLDASQKGLAKLQGSSCSILIFLTVTAANIRLLNISFDQYCQLCKTKAGREPPKDKPVARVVTAFNVAMRILWSALADRDRWSLKLLALISVAEPLGTPLHLVRRLPVFLGTVSDRFSPALDLLLSCGIISIGKNGAGCEIISMHQQIFNWVRRHIRHTCQDQEFNTFIHSWADVLEDEIEGNFTHSTSYVDRWWALAPVIWSVINAAAPRTVKSVKFLRFIIGLAELIIEDRRLPNYAGIFIDEAYKVWSSLLCKELRHPLAAESFFIRIKHVRTRAYLCVSERLLAEQDLRHAKNALSRIAVCRPSPELKRKTEELEVRVCLAQERYAEAEKLLDYILDNPEPGVSDETLAQRHNWMSGALSSQFLDVAAIQHSHCAMRYWAEQPKEMQWGKTDVTMLGWVEKHTSLLINLQKYRGAYLFLPKLFDSWTEWVPYGSPVVWRIANSTVFCYACLDKVSEAEKIAIRMLEMSPIDETHGADSICLAIHLLHELGVLYLRHGRNVEAEGIFRFNLRTIKKRDVKPFLAGSSEKIPADWWAQLVVVLNIQGKYKEARAVRDEYQDEKHDEKFIDRFLADGERKYATSREIYQRAIWAEEEGTLREWKMLLRESGEAKERSAYRRATKQWGSVTRRVREGRDFASEVDVDGVGLARRSKILNLLNRNLIYLSFTAKFPPPSNGENEEDIWIPAGQHVLGEFFTWCDCRRKRPRSGSINPVDLVDKRFIRKAAAQEEEGKKMKQLYIVDYFFVMVQHPPERPEGCKLGCPCIAANQRGEAEFADMEYKLWDCDDSLQSPYNTRFNLSSKPLMKTSALLPNEVFVKEKDGAWRWVQSELATGEGPDENYIVPNSLNIPILTITPPDGEEELTKVKNEEDIQPKITKYFERNYAYDMMMREMKRSKHVRHVLDDILEDDEDEEADVRGGSDRVEESRLQLRERDLGPPLGILTA